MTRKRCRKLLMACGATRNEVNRVMRASFGLTNRGKFFFCPATAAVFAGAPQRHNRAHRCLQIYDLASFWCQSGRTINNLDFCPRGMPLPRRGGSAG